MVKQEDFWSKNAQNSPKTPKIRVYPKIARLFRHFRKLGHAHWRKSKKVVQFGNMRRPGVQKTPLFWLISPREGRVPKTSGLTIGRYGGYPVLPSDIYII